MYKEYFAFNEHPFSIVPSSRYLFLSQRHREAMQHLQAGLGEGGGFALLTGEVGTGKTTVARAMLAALDDKTRAGFILNPTFSDIELLEAICDEFAIQYQQPASLKQLSQAIYQFLLNNHAQGVNTLLVIDEAQHLAADVLEQLRLLTNLETDSRKLLKVLLIGQPELQQKLQLPQLRQLAQRITGRYHLLPLNEEETAHYIHFRLKLAGGNPELFNLKSSKWIAAQTHGIPRLINLVCDACLKLAYQQGVREISFDIVRSACQDIMKFQSSVYQPPQSIATKKPYLNLTVIAAGALIAIAAGWFSPHLIDRVIAQQIPLPALPKPITMQVTSPQLESDVRASSQLEDAVSDLYKVWGYQAALVDSFCSNEIESLFRCQRELGNLDDIEKIGLPVVLTLNIGQTTGYAVLYGLVADQVQLILADKRVQIDRALLLDLWSGEYRYIWQRQLTRTLKLGMQGRDVQILNQKLSQVLGEPVSESVQFNGSLKRQVELFQRWQNMDVDGIAGSRTLRQLELLTQQDAPALMMTEEKI